MYAFNSEFRNSLGVRRVRWRESAVIMLRRAGASATSLAPLLWPARSPLHYHKLLSAEAAAGNGWRSRYIYGSVEVGSAEIWLRCLISEPEKGDRSHRNAGVKANRRAPFAPQATEEEYFPDGTVEEPIRSRTILAKEVL